MIQSDQQAQDICTEQEVAAGLRGNYEATWEQIARRVLPAYATQFQGANRTSQTPGIQHTEEMIDSTAALALTRFAAAMESMLTPSSSTWHTIVPSNLLLMKDRDTRIWCEEVTRLLFKLRYAATANFASQKHEDYMMLGAFGTGNLFIDALDDPYTKGLRYRAVHLGQCYFKENHQGIIDTNYRKFELTARQAVQQFGASSLPESIVKDAASPRGNSKPYWFIHKVAPRADYDQGRKDLKGMAYESCYVSITGKVTVRENGYHTFPYAISRYVTGPGELYGRSPAMMALPTIKSLNEMKKTLLKQGHRTVDPVLLAYDDGVVDSFSLRPGAINPGGVNQDGKPLVHALPTGNLAVGDKIMEQEKLVINDFFLVTLFQILVDTPQMTATEVIERAREKGALLSPTMGRQQSESLGPMITRELDVLRELRLLPPMPPALLEAQGEVDFQYVSPLSRMARSEEAAGFMRTVEYAKEIFAVTQDPSLMDSFNFDTAMPELADIQAVPTRWMNSLAEVKAIRDGRAKQMQMQQMIQAAPALSNMAKTVLPKPPQAAPVATG
jgi:head-to-tail connecting protein